MKLIFSFKEYIPVLMLIVFFSTNGFTQSLSQPVIDNKQAKAVVDDILISFEEAFLKGDSVTLASMYTKDATFGSVKGKDILTAWGSMIRNSINSNSRHLKFTTTSLTVDSEFIIEVGVAEFKDDQGNSKSKGKYLVVYKQEGGTWKLYRDFGL